MKKGVIENFDEVNINYVEKTLIPKQQKKQAFTMLQGNTKCNVEVTEGSMEKCVNMLFS